MYPFEKFAEDAKKVLTMAQEEAERGHYPYIGTEHLLLGVLRGDGPGGDALRSLNVRIEDVRPVIDKVLDRNERILGKQIIPTSRVKKVIELSFEESHREGHNFVDTGHLLVALMLEGEGIAAHVLQDLGATRSRIANAVLAARKHMPAHPVQPRDLTGIDTEALLRLVRTPHLARLLASKGLDVEAVEEVLSHPSETVVRLRSSIAHLRAEMQTMIAARAFEKAARLQEGEKDLLKRLTAAENEWLEGLGGETSEAG
jgi:hypothetical protein